MRLTKTEELRILRKFICAIHGESWNNTSKIMKRILEIGCCDGLQDLINKYKIKMKEDKRKL